MGYVGNSPAEKYTTIDKQVITGNGTVGPYTLTHSVGNEQEIEVFVNNVRQEPGVAYTVSANQLTMGGTVAAADDFYIVFQGKAKMTATHPPTFDLNAANGTFTGDLTVDTNTLYVDSTNNRVGVGTSSPNQKLHVYDSSTNATHIRTTNSNGDIFYGLDVTGSGYAWMNSGSGSFYVGTNGAGDLIAYAGSAERMRINSSGNVGIGTSSPNSFYSLADNLVVGTGSGGNGMTIYSGSADSGYIGFNDTASASMQGFIQYNHNGDYMAFAPNGTEKMRINSTGNVSIGTAATPEKLSIEAPLSTLAGLGLTYSGATKAVFSVLPSTGEVRIGGTAANYFPTFYSSGAERMRIDSTGNLLVGTTDTVPSNNTSGGDAGVAISPDGVFRAARTGNVSLDINRMGSDGEIAAFRKDGTTVGDIGVNNGDNLRIQGNSSHSGIEFGTNAIFPHKNGSNVDATIDLGESSLRWKDLYLSGGVVFGATGGAVTSKTLDDYEEGVWYPVLKASTINPTYTANNTVGYYVKIGNMVYVTWYSSVLNITNSGSGGAQIGNLPFTAASASQEYWLFQYQHGTGIAGTNTSGGYVERNNNNLIFIQQGTVLNSTWVQLNGRYVMVSAAYRTV